MDIALLRRIAAFTEYVARPLTDDLRVILEKAVELKLPLSERLIRDTVIAVGIWHVVGEVIRAISYIMVTLIICRTVGWFLPQL